MLKNVLEMARDDVRELMSLWYQAEEGRRYHDIADDSNYDYTDLTPEEQAAAREDWMTLQADIEGHLAAVGFDWYTVGWDTYTECVSALNDLIERVKAIEDTLCRYDEVAKEGTYTVLARLCSYPDADLYKVEVRTGEGLCYDIAVLVYDGQDPDDALFAPRDWQGAQPKIDDGVDVPDVEWMEYTTGDAAVVVDGLPRLMPWA